MCHHQQLHRSAGVPAVHGRGGMQGGDLNGSVLLLIYCPRASRGEEAIQISCSNSRSDTDDDEVNIANVWADIWLINNVDTSFVFGADINVSVVVVYTTQNTKSVRSRGSDAALRWTEINFMKFKL